MSDYPPTIVLRHTKENLKKCSLRGLEERPDFLFFRYPLYPNNLKNWHLDRAKAPGLTDRKRVHISNIDPLAIDQSRELSHGPNANSSGCLGIQHTPPYAGYILLSLEASVELSYADHSSGLLIIDGTWRYAEKMSKNIPQAELLIKRRLPKNIVTAYPRRQEDCSEPLRGLASLEAIYCAYVLMKRSTGGLLDHYHWKDSFLEKNNAIL